MLLLSVLSLLLAITIGSEPIPPLNVWRALWLKFIHHEGHDLTTQTIVGELRLPRALLALMVGSTLGVVGAAFQGLLRNPLADPYIVGVSSGAAVGAALAVLLGWEGRWYGLGASSFAFVFGLITLLAVIGLARASGQLQVETFLLAGVAVGATLWAVVTLLLLWAGQDLSRVLYWLMGSLMDATWDRLKWCLILLLVGFTLLMSQARALNLYTIGEETACHLGVNTERLKWFVLVGGSLMTAAVVSVAGIIGFVGLIVPHILRRLVGGDHRFLLPLAALGGGVLLIWADTIARLLVRPTELPVGVVTALLGTPFFLWIMGKQVRRGS